MAADAAFGDSDAERRLTDAAVIYQKTQWKQNPAGRFRQQEGNSSDRSQTMSQKAG